MLVILKIPVVYLCAVVWWAIRAEPRPLEGAARLAPLDPPPGCNWRARASAGRWGHTEPAAGASARGGRCSRGHPSPGRHGVEQRPGIVGQSARGRPSRVSSRRSRSSSACSASSTGPHGVIPVAIIVALIAARMTERHGKLAGWAVGVGAASFVIGMGIAVLTRNPLY